MAKRQVIYQEKHEFPTQAELLERTKRLQPFRRGIVINVPLELLPTYMQMYGLTPKGMSAANILHVKGGETK